MYHQAHSDFAEGFLLLRGPCSLGRDNKESEEEPACVMILFNVIFGSGPWFSFVHFLPERIEALMDSLAELLWAVCDTAARDLC